MALEQKWIYADEEWIKELSEKAEELDYYKGYSKGLEYALEKFGMKTHIVAEQTEPQQVVRLKHFKCPKCGRSDYIRSFEDWGVDGGIYKYKCINCNTYIKDEPQTERSSDA